MIRAIFPSLLPRRREIIGSMKRGSLISRQLNSTRPIQHSSSIIPGAAVDREEQERAAQ